MAAKKQEKKRPRVHEAGTLLVPLTPFEILTLVLMKVAADERAVPRPNEDQIARRAAASRAVYKMVLALLRGAEWS